MKVKQLIAALSKENPERLVVCSCDAEGNGHSPLDQIYRAAYAAETTWGGYIGLEKLTAKNRRAGYAECDVLRDGIPAIVLVPTN